MQDIYQRIWSGDKTLTRHDLEKIDGHERCYLSLYYASQKMLLEAKDVLANETENQKDHVCSIILEANSLICYFSKNFTLANDYARKALTEMPPSIFANWVLARTALLSRKYDEAIQHYQNILNVSPDSDTTKMNIAEAYALSKNFKAARQYVTTAQPTPRKRLYKFFLGFGHLWTRLLWLLIICTLLALNPHLFILVYLLFTIFFIWVFVKWGCLLGDMLLFRSSLYIQSINSIFFFITLCALLDK